MKSKITLTLCGKQFKFTPEQFEELKKIVGQTPVFIPPQQIIVQPPIQVAPVIEPPRPYWGQPSITCQSRS